VYWCTGFLLDAYPLCMVHSWESPACSLFCDASCATAVLTQPLPVSSLHAVVYMCHLSCTHAHTFACCRALCCQCCCNVAAARPVGFSCWHSQPCSALLLCQTTCQLLPRSVPSATVSALVISHLHLSAMCTHVWLVACAHSLLLLQSDGQLHIAAAHLTQRTHER